MFNKIIGILESSMPQYVFKMKKGELEIEFSSDDAEFVEQQLAKWREEILKKHDKQ